jgi:hypothetical protein
MCAKAEAEEGLVALALEFAPADPGVTGNPNPRPALRTALRGWLGYMDAAILDWTQNNDIPREKLRELLLAAFASTLIAAQQVDPTIDLRLDS